MPGVLDGIGTLPGLIGQPMPGQSLRPVPGQSGGPGHTFYDRLDADDPQAETELREVFKTTRIASQEGREMLERGWWQKLLYLAGRQWIYYTARGGWQDKRVARWIPRPVTNICSETVQAVRSMLQTIEVSARIRPNGHDPANVLTAAKADEMEPAINEEHEMPKVFAEADWWGPALGTVFLHPYWDNQDPTHTEFVQAKGCPGCGYLAHPLDVQEGKISGCPDCGADASTFTNAVDGQGQPVGDDEIVGRGRTRVISPLEMLIPIYFQRWSEVDRLICLTWRPKSYYEGRPYFSQINFRSTPADRSLQMYRSLATMSEMTTAPYQGSGATASRVEGTIEAELWVKPNAQYPDGLWCQSVGGANGEAYIIRDDDRGIRPGPLPYRDVKGRPLWPWMYLPYEETGGRIWAKSALDPVIPKQDQINRNDSMVELIMQRMANPIWLEPKGAEVQRFTGEPGLIVRYQVVAGTNAKPERLTGVTPSPAFFTLRQQYFADAQRMSGSQDVLAGVKPRGVEAFSAMNLLVERSEARFTSVKKARGLAYRDWYAVAIELERVYGPRTRTWARKGQDPNTWLFTTFQKADLQGAITVLVEDGTDTPKTSLGKRAALQQLQQMGFRFEAPDQQYGVFELTGMTSIAPVLSAQITAAQVEHEQYEQWVAGGRMDPATGAPSAPAAPPVAGLSVPGQPVPATGPPAKPGPLPGNPLVVHPWQNHRIFIDQLDIWANGDNVRALLAKDPAVALELTANRTAHVIALSNQFGLPIPPTPPTPPTEAPKTVISLKGPDLHDPLVQQVLAEEHLPVTPISAQPPPSAHPAAGQSPKNAAQGGAMAGSARESGAVDTLPGAAPGGGNMSGPA